MDGYTSIRSDGMLVMDQRNISIDELVFMAKLLGVISDED